MAAARLRIAYELRETDLRAREQCRQRGEHDWPEQGRDGAEKPGTYLCAECGAIKVVTRRL